MAIELKMPALSPTMEEGTLAKWLIGEGDTVAAGDIMAEIETDKATMEFEAVDEGVLAKIIVAEGTDGVPVGSVIAMIAEEGEDLASVSAPAAPASAATPAPAEPAPAAPAEPAAPAKDGIKISPSARRLAEERGVDLNAVVGTGPKGRIVKSDIEAAPAGEAAPAAEPVAAAPQEPAPAPVAGDRIKASPLAKRLAEQNGVDLAAVSGTGPKGRIIKADIEQAVAQGGVQAAASGGAPTAAAQPVIADGEIPHDIAKLSNMRKTIARRLTEAKQTVPHIYLTVDIQLDAMLALRAELNKTLEAREIKLSVNDLLIKALGVALMTVPKCNVSFAGDQLISYHRADISVAVSVPNGLITPIITEADTKSLSTISTEMKELAGRAKEGTLLPHEYQGGTASLSNMGMFGIKQFDAVINPPQGMIMAISAGEKRPYVIDDSLQIATVMSATGSFDHRAIDGADGAQLMKTFKELVESPLGMLA